MFRGTLSAAFLYQPHNSGCPLQPVCSHLSWAGPAFGTWVASLSPPLPLLALAATALALGSEDLACYEAAGSPAASQPPAGFR